MNTPGNRTTPLSLTDRARTTGDHPGFAYASPDTVAVRHRYPDRESAAEAAGVHPSDVKIAVLLAMGHANPEIRRRTRLTEPALRARLNRLYAASPGGRAGTHRAAVAVWLLRAGMPPLDDPALPQPLLSYRAVRAFNPSRIEALRAFVDAPTSLDADRAIGTSEGAVASRLSDACAAADLKGKTKVTALACHAFLLGLLPDPALLEELGVSRPAAPVRPPAVLPVAASVAPAPVATTPWVSIEVSDKAPWEEEETSPVPF